MRLDKYDHTKFNRGRPFLVEFAWVFIEIFIFATGVPGSCWRVFILRLFGARLGKGVVIKPSVKVKFPWRLVIGDHSWVGERVWIDNLAEVRIGSHCCISQGAYLCTGNHDWSKETFDLNAKGIQIYDCVWVASKAIVGPGVEIGEGAVLSLGSVATHCLEPWSIYQGNPAVFVVKRPRARS